MWLSGLVFVFEKEKKETSISSFLIARELVKPGTVMWGKRWSVCHLILSGKWLWSVAFIFKKLKLTWEFSRDIRSQHAAAYNYTYNFTLWSVHSPCFLLRSLYSLHNLLSICYIVGLDNITSFIYILFVLLRLSYLCYCRLSFSTTAD